MTFTSKSILAVQLSEDQRSELYAFSPIEASKSVVCYVRNTSKPVKPYLNTYFFQPIDFPGGLAKFPKTWHYAPKVELLCFTLAFGPL
jgi:hypothetical protein